MLKNFYNIFGCAELDRERDRAEKGRVRERDNVEESERENIWEEEEWERNEKKEEQQ